MEPGGRGCFLSCRGGMDTLVLVTPNAKAPGFDGRVEMQCDTTTSFWNGSWREPGWWCHLAPKQKSSRTGQLHSKRLVLLQLPACESHFQFYSGTLFYIDVIHLYIYIYVYNYYVYMIYEFPIFVASVPTENQKLWFFHLWWLRLIRSRPRRLREGDIGGSAHG